jgi:fructose-1,6-bisphosphatase/inositol monophosphatase family enzyme
MTPDTEVVSRIIREAADAEIMPRFQKLASHEVSEKKPGDLVTAADLGVERVLTERLTGLIPGSRVVGEEATHHDAGLTGLIAAGGACWVIDPVDGTSNFADGKPMFGVQVAFVQGGLTRAAWLYHPVSRRMVAAEVGAGAWLDGARLKVLEAGTIETMRGALYAGPSRPGMHPEFKARAERYGEARYRRCCAQEYLDMVTGALHFALFTRLLPWDHAAGAFIHAEAGGYGRLTDGKAYVPTVSEGYILLTPDEASWRLVRAHFLAA